MIALLFTIGLLLATEAALDPQQKGPSAPAPGAADQPASDLKGQPAKPSEESLPEDVEQQIREATAILELPDADQTPEKLKRAERLLIQAAARGDEQEAGVADNLRGLILCQQKRFPEAITLFTQLLKQSEDDPERYVVTYNLGWAHHQNGQLSQALGFYREALEQEPGMDLAIDKSIEIIKTLPLAQANEEFAGLARFLRRLRRRDVLMEHEDDLMKLWGQSEESQRLLTSILADLARRSFDPRDLAFLANVPEEFRTVPTSVPEANRLTDIARKYPILVPAIQQVGKAFENTQVGKAFEDTEEPLFDPDATARRYSQWTGKRWKTDSFAALLRSVGDKYRRPPDGVIILNGPRKALGKYSSAWMLNPKKFDAVLPIAYVLAEGLELVDPDGQIVVAFDRRLREADTETGEKAPETIDDWLCLRQAHVVLGDAFAGRNVLGDGQDPRGAIAQWQRAISVDERIAKMVGQRDEKVARLLEVRYRQAAAWLDQSQRKGISAADRTSARRAAFDQFLTIARSYEYWGDPIAAREFADSAGEIHFVGAERVGLLREFRQSLGPDPRAAATVGGTPGASKNPPLPSKNPGVPPKIPMPRD